MFRPKVGSAKKIWEPHPPTHVLMLAVQHCISTQWGGFGDISGLAFMLAYLFRQLIFCSGHFWFPSVVWRTHTDAWIVVTSLKSLLSELVFHCMSQLCIWGIYVFTVLRTCPLKPQLSVAFSDSVLAAFVAGAAFSDSVLAVFVAGAAFGDSVLAVFVAGAAFSDSVLAVFVAGTAFGNVGMEGIKPRVWRNAES